MNSIGKGLAVLALTAVTTTSYAEVRAFHGRANNFFTAVVGGVDVPLNNAGQTIISFNLPARGRKVLTYSAECAVNAATGNPDAWLDLDIYVNGQIVLLTSGAADAFCSSDDVAGFGHWVRPSISLAINVLQGNNNIRIRARGNNGATGLWLGDSALVVHD